MKPRLNFMYLHSPHIGYGYQGVATHKAFERIGIDVFDGLPGSGDLDIKQKNSAICNDVLFLSTPTHVRGWWSHQRAHLFTMWEGTSLPEAMRESLHNFKTVVVPSEHCLELFSRYHKNVHYVPLGVDSERWAYTPRRQGTFFNFLVSGSGPRKGADLARRAFHAVFGNFAGDGPIPRLVIKDPRGHERPGPSIDVISGYLHPDEEVQLYADAHCFLAPSRGEGWGMQPLQAIAQGIPTILTDAHGHRSFSRFGLPISSSFAKSDYFLFGDAGDWWEPDFDALCDRMKWVYEHYDFESYQAKVNAHVVARRFTWENSADQIVKSIGGYTRLSEDTRHEGVWRDVECQKFELITTRDWRADIAGVTHVFKKGATYMVSADVKRVLFEGGALDPACLKDGAGLASEQLARIGEVYA